MGHLDRADNPSTHDMRIGGHLSVARPAEEVRPGVSRSDAMFVEAPTRGQSRYPLSRKAFAMLRAVAAGRAELVLRREFDMFVDGAPCRDQFVAHQLASTGLVRPSRPGLVGHRVPAILTEAGHAALGATPSVA